jgi:hypothetical protein
VNFLFFELLKFTLFLGVCLFSAIVVFIVIEKNTYSVHVRTYTRVSTGKEFRRNFYIPYLQTSVLEDAHVFEIYSHENVHVQYLYVYVQSVSSSGARRVSHPPPPSLQCTQCSLHRPDM